MISSKYIGMDVHKESISMAVRNAAGKIVMESVIETKANATGIEVPPWKSKIHSEGICKRSADALVVGAPRLQA